MSWKSTIKKAPTWKDSIMRSKPFTATEIRSQIIESIMPEIKEKTSWKNTLSIVPKNGLDGADGKDGKRGPKGEKGDQGPQGIAGIDGKNGLDGINGKDGINGSQIYFMDSAPTDEGNSGDLVLINKTFELFYKDGEEWIKKGSLMGAKGGTGYVSGLNGESAYQIAVKYGFFGTEEEWVNSLGGAQVEYAQRIDEASATVTYIGKAEPGSAESAPVWQIKRVQIVGTETETTWADGDVQFNNVWDSRASISYA